MSRILFIDANMYLDLFRTNSGKQLLDTLEEQQQYIFVTKQIVWEVERNKVREAATYLAKRQLKLDSVAVPDHILSTTDNTVEVMRKQLRNIGDQVEKTKEEFRKLADDLLKQVSRSQDEVSKRLAHIFSHAVIADREELQRASGRKRIGNPPGKKIDSLGDQISWEQLLTYCKAKGKPKLWIITRDSDYATAYDKRLYLNAFLYSELAQVFNAGPEVFCFDNIPDAVKHFSETERIKADKLPTPEETKQIKEEQASLPRVDWLKGYDDGGFSVIQNTILPTSEFYRAALRSMFASDRVVLPTDPGDSTEKL